MRPGQNVMGLLKMTVEVFHQTLLVITHDLELAQMAESVVRLRDGKTEVQKCDLCVPGV